MTDRQAERERAVARALHDARWPDVPRSDKYMTGDMSFSSITVRDLIAVFDALARFDAEHPPPAVAVTLPHEGKVE